MCPEWKDGLRSDMYQLFQRTGVRRWQQYTRQELKSHAHPQGSGAEALPLPALTVYDLVSPRGNTVGIAIKRASKLFG